MITALLVLAAAVFLLLGTAHGVLTLRDLKLPRTFTPTDESVLEAMRASRLAIHPSANLWRAWLGFNLSHSLGLLVFGGVLAFLALVELERFTAQPIVQLGCIAVTASYLALAIRFWFSKPAIAAAIALAGVLGATVLSYL